jgi:hypothetical protein
MRDPKTLAAVLDRVEAWDVSVGRGYDPGWTYAKALPATEADTASKTVKDQYLRDGRAVVSLLNIPEYLAALRESEDASAGDLSDEQKLKAALERHRRAQERMCAIETKMKVALMCGRKQ